MAQEDVDAFKRAVEAANRGDIDAVLDEVDWEVEWYPALPGLLGGKATVYRGRDGAREALQDLYDSFAELHFELSNIRDVDCRLLAIGRMRGRGTESGVEIESPWAYLVDFRNGKALRVRSYTNPEEALEAAGLRN
jgi:ketosteroid isomerase-like protein